MFYSSTDIDERLKCAFCRETFFDVVKFVPGCGESICGFCYEELKENLPKTKRFKCNACQESHKMPKAGFTDNKFATRILEAKKVEKPLSEQAQTLKRFVELAPSQLRALETFDERDHINHHCDQLEVEVIEEIDSLVKHLNEIGIDLLKQIRDYREGRLESLSARSSWHKETGDKEITKTGEELSALSRDLRDFTAKWSDYFSRVDAFVTDGEVEAALNTTKHFEIRMRTMDDKLKSNALDGQIMKFKISHTTLEEHCPLRNLFVLLTEKTDQRIHPNTLATFTGHSEKVFQVLFLSQDRIASCSKDTTIRIWNVKSRSQLLELKGHSDWVNSLVLLKNGWLASSSRDTTIKMWDLEQRKPIRTLHGHTASIVSLKTLKNGNLVSYSLDDTIRIWNPFLNEKNIILTISGHGNNNWLIPLGVLSNDNVVTCSRGTDSKEDCVLRVWNPNDGALVSSVSTGCTGVWPVLVLSNDQIALGFFNGTIKIVDLSDHSKTRTTQRAFSGPVSSFEQMLNGNLISGGLDSNTHTIKVWNLFDLALIYSIPTEHSQYVSWIRSSSNGQFLVTASYDKTIKLWAITN